MIHKYLMVKCSIVPSSTTKREIKRDVKDLLESLCEMLRGTGSASFVGDINIVAVKEVKEDKR